jgi:DNA repair protein RadC
MKYLRKLNIRLVKGKYKNPVRGQVREPEQVYEVFKSIKDKAQETLIGLYLNNDLDVLTYDILSTGGAHETALLPDEIFGRAFVMRAKYIILIHNHPSGHATPSPEDRQAMQLIAQGARLMNKHLLDFIIVGDNAYWSLFDEFDGGSYELGAIV